MIIYGEGLSSTLKQTCSKNEHQKFHRIILNDMNPVPHEKNVMASRGTDLVAIQIKSDSSYHMATFASNDKRNDSNIDM